MKRRAAAVSNDPVAVAAARDLLAAGSSATAAVLAGFFAAAGAHSGVLLGPISVLVSGIGVGARAFDGRLRQPGLGAKRPRGFTEREPIPEQARLAVPTSPSAALVALAYDGSQRSAAVLKPGIALAERAGAEGRASVLKLVRSSGAAAFSDQGFVRAMLRAAGPSQGGSLSPADFAPPTDVDHDARAGGSAAAKLFAPPWAEPPVVDDLASLGAGFAVCAVDPRGVFAAVCYRRVIDGFVLGDLELEAPLAASPVLRGVTRIAPGARIGAPSPIAIRCDAAGVPVEVLAAPGALTLGPAELAAAPLLLRRSPSTQDVEIVAGG